jgi:hypothetical protein
MFKMINKNVKQVTAQDKIEKPQDKEKNTIGEQVPEKLKIKKRKRHSSALAAAAQGESVVSATNARSSGDVGFGTTGTNLTYKEDGGSL